MKTKTQVVTAPAAALRRVAVVAAVLLTLCLVFMMPVGAAGVPALPTAEVNAFTADDWDKYTLTSPYENKEKGPYPDLTVALNFTANPGPDGQLEYYSNWFVDFFITTNKEIDFYVEWTDDKLNGLDGWTYDSGAEITNQKDGYFGGYYQSAFPGKWVIGPSYDITISKDTPMPVVTLGTGMPQLLTYGFVFSEVKTFLCGINLNDEFLLENQDLEVKLELLMFDFSDQDVFGPDGEFVTRLIKEDSTILPPDEADNYMDWVFSYADSILPHMNILLEYSNPVGKSFTYGVVVNDGVPSLMPKYTVTFDADGGSVNTEKNYVIYTGNYGELPTPTKEGYEFAGWFSAETGGAKVTEDKIVNIAEDHTLYAKWIKVTADVTAVNFGTVQEGYTQTTAKVTLTNTGNVATDFKVGDLSSNFIVSYNTQDTNLELTETYQIVITPKNGLTADTYSDTLTIQVGEESSIEIPVTITVIDVKEDEKETIVVPTLPSVGVDETTNEDGTTTTTSVTVADDNVDADGTTGEDETTTATISATPTTDGGSSEPVETVVLKITEVKVTNLEDTKKLELTENSEIIAEYPEISTEADEESDCENAEAVDVQLSINLKSVNTNLPVISPKFDPVIEDVVAEESQKNGKAHAPVAMITATNVDEVNKNIKGEGITIYFYITEDVYKKFNGKFLVYHVKSGKVQGEPQSVTPVKDGDRYKIEAKGNGFSSYVLAADTTSQGNVGTPDTGGSATDTGSGNYQYYPRSVPTDGIVDFGTSKVVTGMELPAGSDGTVTLNIKPTFDIPENGFYAFEIDAPGYNLDAKINGGLSFQIPVADLEAAGWTAEDIVLFHGTVGEDGKITWEALPTNLVKNENGVAYYKAAIAGCSPFYIGFVKDGSVVNTEAVDPTVPETPEQPEVLPPVEEPTEEPATPASPAPILAVLAGLGAVVALRRK